MLFFFRVLSAKLNIKYDLCINYLAALKINFMLEFIRFCCFSVNSSKLIVISFIDVEQQLTSLS